MSELHPNDELPSDAEVDAVHDKVFVAEVVPLWLSRNLVGTAMTLANKARATGGMELAKSFFVLLAEQMPVFASLTPEQTESWAAIKTRLISEVFEG
jgi:hypothetical protein